MKKYIFTILVFIIAVNAFAVKRDCEKIISKEIIINDIRTSYVVLDEWKNPGLYSPTNMFDGDINTCFAEGHLENGVNGYIKNVIYIAVSFKHPVYADEIRILNGFSKNDTYYKNNNRVKHLRINVPPNRGAQMTMLTLEDKREWQSFKFDKSYPIEVLHLSNDGKDESIYKGDRYDDTCITEIELYNNGQKIPVQNIIEAKVNYLKGIQYFLDSIFAEGQDKKKYKWKVEDYKLYRYANNKWQLTRYYMSSDDCIEAFDEKENCNTIWWNNDQHKCYRFNKKN